MTPHDARAEALLPCPFCGDEVGVYGEDVPPRVPIHRVECACGTVTAAYASPNAAIRAWNRRAPAPPAPAPPAGEAEDEAVRAYMDALLVIEGRQSDCPGLASFKAMLARRDELVAREAQEDMRARCGRGPLRPAIVPYAAISAREGK